MKLYTEEQLRHAIEFGLNNTHIIGFKDDDFIEQLTPIELPSDEEIDEDMENQSGEYACGWEDAFKWLKEQILNQNK